MAHFFHEHHDLMRHTANMLLESPRREIQDLSKNVLSGDYAMHELFRSSGYSEFFYEVSEEVERVGIEGLSDMLEKAAADTTPEESMIPSIESRPNRCASDESEEEEGPPATWLV